MDSAYNYRSHHLKIKKSKLQNNSEYIATYKRILMYANIYRKLRTCRCGAGTEKNPGKCDTPGFPLQTEASLKQSGGGFKQLMMPRNDPTMNQSSLDMLQSWRGNCDVQILIYTSNPNDPDPSEIAQVVDYIIGYVCKGNHTFQEELTQFRSLLESTSDETNSSIDVVKLARKLLNKSAANRLISKQETMVLLLDLNLVLCSDRFDLINISSTSVVAAKTNQKSFLSEYKFRKNQRTLTLHQYYHFKKDQDSSRTKDLWYIPVYTGINTKPRYPPEFGYAKAQLLIHSPWIGSFEFNKDGWEDKFENFIQSKKCPAVAKIPYERAMLIHFNQLKQSEPKATQPQLDLNMTKENEDLLALLHEHNDGKDIDTDAELYFGETYEWSSKLKVRTNNKLTIYNYLIAHKKFSACGLIFAVR